MTAGQHDRSYKDPLREFQPPTAVIHAGYRSRLSENAVKVPLFRTSTFEFDTAAEGARFFERAYHLPGDDGKEPGLVYSRINNPNTEIFEDKMVAAEAGAEAAAAFPSGMSAITTSVLALVPQGGRILFGVPVYGGTYFFFKRLCPERFGIEAVPVRMDVPGELDRALAAGRCDMVFIETPANPTLVLTDIAAAAGAARAANPAVLVAVDNTFLGPVFQRPFSLGADLVLYSATKFIGGHSDLVAGVVLARDPARMARIRDFRTILGATIGADTAWLLTRSLETVWMRMERQMKKAMKVARALREHPKVARVLYPDLLVGAGGPQETIYLRQCSGPGSILSFTLKDPTREAAFRLLDALEVCHLAVSLGGTESLISHPRSTTHSDMTSEDLDACGITESMVRLSVGLESSTDLIGDLFRALERV